jgi:hypothetical protein
MAWEVWGSEAPQLVVIPTPGAAEAGETCFSPREDPSSNARSQRWDSTDACAIGEGSEFPQAVNLGRHSALLCATTFASC